jgi:serine phosphatase RsbU (regulator of sigma subunit)
MKLKIGLILYLLVSFLYANSKTDSLKIVSKIDSARSLFTIDVKKALKISREAYSQSIRLKNAYLESYCLNTIGSSFYYEGNIDSSIIYHSKALTLQLANNLKIGIGRSFTNLGLCYIEKSKPEEAISNFIKAEPYFKAENFKVGLSKLYNSLGVLFYELNQISKSETYYLKALEIALQSEDNTTLYNVYSNLANIYSELNNTEKSIKYYSKALSIAETQDENSDVVFILNNLCGDYLKLKLQDSAIKYSSMAMSLIKTHSLDYHFKKNSYGNYAEILRLKVDFKNAIVYIDSAILFAKMDEDPIKIYQLQIIKEDLLFSSGNYNLSRQLAIKNRFLYDSINETKLKSKTNELETKYETEKKELQIKNQSLEIYSQEKENKQKSLIILLGSLALIASGFFGFVAFINFRKTKKANVIIENQKQEVEYKNTEITHQKELLEEKQKEIIDSINYAQRIQQAVLTGEDVWNKISKENFIVFKPRDIVSGDFYWAHLLPNGRAIFALADCTGHGVPGGFMSMLGNAFLNELVVENKLFKADELLNRLREKVIAALLQKGESNQKDGMDMALCVWNKMDNTLEFAGANNSLYLVREMQLLEYKGDKMPIGTYLEENKKFTAQKIQLQTNDFIYLSTDGFADQFGGPKGKKLKYRKLEQLLVEQSINRAQLQKQALENAFNEWKNDYEQTDDVSVIGVKVM